MNGNFFLQNFVLKSSSLRLELGCSGIWKNLILVDRAHMKRPIIVFFNSAGWGEGSFLFLYLFYYFWLSLAAYLLILYLLISFSRYFLFLCSFFLSFFVLFSIFLAPASKLFRVRCVNKLHHGHLIFYVNRGVSFWRNCGAASMESITR